jgi:hypothetical protein
MILAYGSSMPMGAGRASRAAGPAPPPRRGARGPLCRDTSELGDVEAVVGRVRDG